MKKLFAVAVLVGLMAPAIAAADCTQLTPCSNGPDPMSLTMSWGLTGYQTPVVKTGTVIQDAFGRTYECPIWFPEHMGCFDLTKTAWYLTQF